MQDGAIPFKSCLQGQFDFFFSPFTGQTSKHFNSANTPTRFRKRMKQIFYVILLALGCFVAVPAAMAQTGTGNLEGKVVDKTTRKPISTANIRLTKNGAFVDGAQADPDGRYSITGLDPGTYEANVTFVGFDTLRLGGIRITADNTIRRDFEMGKGSLTTQMITITGQKKAIEAHVTNQTIGAKEIAKLAARDIGSIAALTAGAYQASEGSGINLKGSRTSGTQYVIDGVKVIGSINLPKGAIEQVSVLSSGLPAQYGDATGGVISVTTRGPSSKYNLSVEGLSSTLFDPYNYNLGSVTLSGPILFRHNKALLSNPNLDSAARKAIDRETRRPLLGFLLAGEVEIQPEPSPSPVQLYEVKPDVLARLRNKPLRPSPLGQGFQANALYITKDSLNEVKTFKNNNQRDYRGSFKIDFAPGNGLRFAMGGRFSHTDYQALSLNNYLFNSTKNGQVAGNTLGAWVRFQQFFKDDTGHHSAITHARYSIQLDYQRSLQNSMDKDLKDNVFAYGYVGQFDVKKAPVYEYKTVKLAQYGNVTGYHQVGFRDTSVNFTAGSQNPLLANYTSTIFDYTANDPVNRPRSLFNIQANNGIINGSTPGSVFSLYLNSGNPYNGYSKSDNSQFRFVAQGFVDVLKNHHVMLGVEYEQRYNTGYNLSPVGLWRQARLLTNAHLQSLDTSNPQFQGFDTINYQRKYEANLQTNFDKNLRTSLGLPVNGTDFINVDALRPENFKLSMFNANELNNAGNAFSDYWGYDYLGNKLKTRPGSLDFFRDTVNRPIAAFQPIYIAGYIEDQFRIEDFDLRFGVRVDRFDANQPVLKDDYLLYPALTAKEVKFDELNARRPANIGDDYTVYVDDFTKSNPKIVGYRNGRTWYDANGNETTGRVLSGGQSQIKPYLVDPNQKNVQANAFKDYTAQVNVMPRLSFSFPVSDESQFFAHYDILTQRPTSAIRFDPREYYYRQQVVGSIVNPGVGAINNPNLRPERTIDYEIGLQQALSKTSSLTITAFYREMRDMVQVIPVNYAYPVSYLTFGNIDFGTVKGLTMSINLPALQNFRVNANYTLQFADGTGSSVTQQVGIINSGASDNLRTLFPLNFDQRHRIVTNFDYGFGHGRENKFTGDPGYTGPRGKIEKILQDVALNAVVNLGSGTPYSRQSNITQDAAFGIQDRSVNRGGLNGSRLPWQFRVDARIDKDFYILTNKKNAGPDKFQGGQGRMLLNVSLQCLNLFDNLNVQGVYRATGNPNDDAFLQSAYGAQTIRTYQTLGQAAAFVDQYGIKVNNPFNYSLPRRLRLGVRLTF